MVKETAGILRSAVRTISSLFNSVSLGFIFLVMFLISADIFGRTFFNYPIPGTYNMTESLMVFIVFLAMANTEARRQNIRIQFFTNRFSSMAQYYLNILVRLAGIFFSGLIVWRTWPIAIESWSIREFADGPVSFPLYPSKFIVPIGMFLLMVQFIYDLVSHIVEKPSRT